MVKNRLEETSIRDFQDIIYIGTPLTNGLDDKSMGSDFLFFFDNRQQSMAMDV